MNLNKARDFYSAYYEGALDSGLSQAFERAMAADARVGAEYAQFVRIMQELKALQTPVEVPKDLHARIRERVDSSASESERQARGAARFFAWRPIAYGAVATLAILGAVASFNSRGNRGVSVAALAPITESAPKVLFAEGVAKLVYSASTKNSVTVTKVPTGQVVFTRALNAQSLDSPFVNASDEPVTLAVSFAHDYGTLYLAVPGHKVSTLSQGEGTALQFAAAVAARYAVPVVMETNAPDAKVVWKLEGVDALASVSDEMKALGMRAEVREGGLIWVAAN